MELPGYNTIDPYAFMNERCPFLPPAYNRPPRRRVLLAELVSCSDCKDSDEDIKNRAQGNIETLRMVRHVS